MKKKRLLVLCLVIVAVIVWWYAPVRFMNNIVAGEIASIEVTGGDTGHGFTITNKDEIEFIVENIKGVSLKKKKISIMYSGEYFALTFINQNGKTIYNLAINSATTIRKDPFFYYDRVGGR